MCLGKAITSLPFSIKQPIEFALICAIFLLNLDFSKYHNRCVFALRLWDDSSTNPRISSDQSPVFFKISSASEGRLLSKTYGFAWCISIDFKIRQICISENTIPNLSSINMRISLSVHASLSCSNRKSSIRSAEPNFGLGPPEK